MIIHGRCKEKCEATLDFLINENRLWPTNRQQSEDDASSTSSMYTSNVDYVAADFGHLSEVIL